MTDPLIESDVKEFIRRLPEIHQEPPEAHLVMIAVRSRFARELMGIKVQDLVVERKIIRPKTDWRVNYFQKVLNLAVLQQNGSYWVQKKTTTGTVYETHLVPHEAKALYATVGPRSATRAVVELIKLCADNLSEANKHENLSRIDVDFFSRLHANRSPLSPKLCTVDIDVADHFKDVRDRLSVFKPWMVTKTSRGYHIILDLTGSEYAKEFHIGGGIWDKIHQKYGDEVELQRDSQEPIPGSLYRKLHSTEPNYVKILE